MSVFRLTEEQYAAKLAKGKVRVTQFVNGFPPLKPNEVAQKPANKQSKFRNVKTEIDGIRFDSRKEAKRWQELKLLESAGDIICLERQVKYPLLPAQERNDGTKERGVDYVADFRYTEMKMIGSLSTGKQVLEDAKGMRTPDYILKRKLLLWVHGISLKET